MSKEDLTGSWLWDIAVRYLLFFGNAKIYNTYTLPFAVHSKYCLQKIIFQSTFLFTYTYFSLKEISFIKNYLPFDTY